MREGEEDASFDDFFDAGKASLSVVIVSSRAASESGQRSGVGGHRDGPVGPVMRSTAASPSADILQHTQQRTDHSKLSSRTISSDSADLNNEELVDPMHIHLRRSNPHYPLRSHHRPRTSRRPSRLVVRRVRNVRGHARECRAVASRA